MTGKKPFAMNMLDLNTKTVLVYNYSQCITFQKTRRDAGQGFLTLTGKSGVRFDLN